MGELLALDIRVAGVTGGGRGLVPGWAMGPERDPSSIRNLGSVTGIMRSNSLGPLPQQAVLNQKLCCLCLGRT